MMFTRRQITVLLIPLMLFVCMGKLLLCWGFSVGLFGVWIAWLCGWLFRAVVYVLRFRKGRWSAHQVLR